jgi:serine/threonine-protein kinase RsbW
VRGGADHLLQATVGPGFLGPVHDLLTRLWADEPDVGQQDRVRFETAVAEVAANIAEHGAAAGAVHVTLRLASSPDRIQAVFEDDGAPVEAGRGQPPAVDAERGRGLPLARAALDRLSYERDGTTNRWVLVLGDR